MALGVSLFAECCNKAAVVGEQELQNSASVHARGISSYLEWQRHDLNLSIDISFESKGNVCLTHT
jgi:hypothetical protein